MAFSLKDYKDIKELAHGGMGVVYKAIQRSLSREVVIKKMSADLALDPKLVKRFENEAKAAAALDDEHVVKIFDFGEDQGSFYIVMEFVEGPDLEHLLRDPDLPKETGLLVMLQAIRGIHHAHTRGISHRDIKPANMIVSAKTGKTKVVDFGLAHVSEQSLHLTAPNAVLGTPLYMSPEQATGQPDSGPLSDVFSVGVLLYRIVTGNFPFTGDNVPAILYNIVHTPEKNLYETAPALPADLAKNISLCLVKDPEKRLPGLLPVIESLQKYFHDIGIRDVPEELANQIKKNTGLWTFLKKLLNYHLSKGKEYAKLGEYAKSGAHLKEALKYDPVNEEVTHLINRIEGLEATIPEAEISGPEVIPRQQIPAMPLEPKKRPAYHRILFPAALLAVMMITAITVYSIRSIGYNGEQASVENLPTQKPSRFAVATALPPKADPAKSESSAATEETPVSGRSKNIGPNAIALAQGILTLDVEPDQALVWIDKKQLQKSERTDGIRLPTGEHDLWVSKAGYEPYYARVFIKQGINKSLSVVLKPAVKAMGVLHVFSNPWADLYVDGQRIGIAPTAKPVPLSEGRHLLVLKRDGYESYEELVTIRQNQTTRVKAEIRKQGE